MFLPKWSDTTWFTILGASIFTLATIPLQQNCSHKIEDFKIRDSFSVNFSQIKVFTYFGVIQWGSYGPMREIMRKILITFLNMYGARGLNFNENTRNVFFNSLYFSILTVLTFKILLH